MSNMPALQLDSWYRDPVTGNTFRIVASDRASDSIEIQYSNGDLAEYDFASWADSVFVPIEAPEDWRGPFDDVEIDDLGYTDPDLHDPHLQGLTLDDLLDDRES